MKKVIKTYALLLSLPCWTEMGDCCFYKVWLSPESAGRRIALFTRLMEEHDIVSLPRNAKTAPFAEKQK